MAEASSLRLFVAVELPEHVRDALAAVQDALRREVSGRLRWTAPTGIHLTLKFLGEVPETRVGVITAALREASAGQAPFALTLSGTGVFPNARSPRVVWVGLGGDVDALGRLQARVEGSLVAAGFPAEDRDFRPHLTLARVADRLSGGQRETLVERVKGALVPEVEPFQVKGVSLMRSILQPTGSVYERQAEATLG